MRVKKTRNLNTWSEAKYWGAVRSALRLAFRYWKPMQEAKKRNRTGKRGSFRYLCCDCNRLFKEKEIQIDHKNPVGVLNRSEDLPVFLERLTDENVDNYQVVCKECHQVKTNQERRVRKEAKMGQGKLFG